MPASTAPTGLWTAPSRARRTSPRTCCGDRAREGDVTFTVDYLDDDVGSYFGTPLIPTDAVVEPLDVITTTTGEGIDARTRFLNYNVSDPVNDSRQVLVRSDLTVRLTDQVTVRNTVYGFDADRHWQNAEGYVYCTSVVDVCTTVGEIQRYYGYFFVDHDQQLFGDRVHLDVRTPLGGLENRATIGFEASTLDFERGRGFRRNVPQVPGDGVDLLSTDSWDLRTARASGHQPHGHRFVGRSSPKTPSR